MMRNGLIGILLLTSACSKSAPTNASRASVTDSAGVRIVSTPQRTAAPELWTVGPGPVTRIGAEDGKPGQDLYRIAGVIRLSDGRVVVANRGSNELRWFDSDGSFLFSRGGEGEGPGEYRGLTDLLGLAGDSVLAADGLRRTVNVYDADGELARSWTIHSDLLLVPLPEAQLDDGSFLTWTEPVLDRTPGVLHHRATLLRFREGTLEDTVATVPGSEVYSGPCRPGLKAICSLPVPYGLVFRAASDGKRIMVGNGDGYSISVLDERGRPTAIYRRPGSRRAVTQSDVDRYFDKVTQGVPAARRAEIRAGLSQAPAADSMPAYIDLRADDTGDLWVELPVPETDGRTDWDVFDDSGEVTARAVLPAGLQVRSISDGYVAGVTTDENQVELVQIYRIEKEADSDASSPAAR